MIGPLALNLSEMKVPKSTAKNPTIFGGTVKLDMINIVLSYFKLTRSLTVGQ